MAARKSAPAGRPLLDPLDEVDPRAPLATRMRPRTLAEFVGQAQLVAPDHPLRRAIESDSVPSSIFWGPPGSGKTTLARIIARETQAFFVQLSAVASGVADLRQVIKEARQRGHDSGQPTILFIDEIHRFNKAQQDAVLPSVEEGTITLIGATTENPSFEVIAPLLSRARVFTLQPLAPPELRTLIERALHDSERGLGALAMRVEEDALAGLVRLSNGDARRALNTLELCVRDAGGTGGAGLVTLAAVEAAAEQRLPYDKAGGSHYDTISAFIKSMRDSDPDAALYWLARMIEAGEDPLFIVRRMVILAAEDVGLADPSALSVAVAAQQAVHFVGMPEGYFPMVEAAIYLALAPKSNSTLTAYGRARADVREHGQLAVPLHLRNAATGLMRSLGYGADYQYAHDYADHRPPDQTHLPPELQGRRYYEPGSLGREPEIAAERDADTAARHRPRPGSGRRNDA